MSRDGLEKFHREARVRAALSKEGATAPPFEDWGLKRTSDLPPDEADIIEKFDDPYTVGPSDLMSYEDDIGQHVFKKFDYLDWLDLVARLGPPQSGSIGGEPLPESIILVYSDSGGYWYRGFSPDEDALSKSIWKKMDDFVAQKHRGPSEEKESYGTPYPTLREFLAHVSGRSLPDTSIERIARKLKGRG